LIDDAKWLQREILLAFWKVHILHHAAEGPIFGQWMLKELRHHGYDVSPGTLYPILSRMEEQGFIKSDSDSGTGSRVRREFRLTSKGQKALNLLCRQVIELHDEVIKGKEIRGKKRGNRPSK
jgi:PadR family transcriptional regulator, regulatory protein PadR